VVRLGIECRRSRALPGGSEAGGTAVVVVDDVVAGVTSGDVAHVGGVDGLVGVSLACMPIPQVLGGSVDIPMSFSRRGGLSLGTVCITALIVLARVVCVLESVVSRVVGSVCSRFVAHASRSAVLPHSSPSFIPFSYPSFSSAIFPFSSDLVIASLTTE
jgi:hypothetical protein